jgi:hypothetical protein
MGEHSVTGERYEREMSVDVAIDLFTASRSDHETKATSTLMTKTE